ncbi:CbtA family protein [Aestuariirhabdus litorea]|uniref:Cobalt transporter n=1 Tax=Aestuariirhabdus litorea TaxID=2528527 RepID=A0A3P3VQC5_9GAMM|nr:CbtA family protein [Aestuariirhabdus litorea]RRJ84527.1 hypothetical protein D0544_05315 [Aestuariirhabdus litorea]RWW97752.1 hypothetical protein DZC74_05310 [Endozoicomonadaceae bacterium GTF-13]
MKLFRQTVYQALAAALFAGLLLTLLQQLGVTPLILQAEQYELAGTTSHAATSDHSHSEAAPGHHQVDEWAPQDGLERHFFTLLSNSLAAFGFALILIAAIRAGQLAGRWPQPGLPGGLAWGTAGFLIFFAAPSLGLPPELPGMVAADLEARQLWWLLCTSSTAVALVQIVLGPLKWKFLALIPLFLPHLVGAPQVMGPHFTHPDPTALAALHSLHTQFIWATGITNALYWLALGAACCWLVARAPLSAEGPAPA